MTDTTGRRHDYASGWPAPVRVHPARLAVTALATAGKTVNFRSRPVICKVLATLGRGAVESRTIIGQATGIIMAQRRCGQDEALNALIKISNDRNIKLREVARMLVEATASGG